MKCVSLRVNLPHFFVMSFFISALYGMYSGAAGARGGLLGSVGVGLTTSSTPSTLISPSTTPSPYSTGSPAPQTTSSAASLLHNTSSTTLGLAASQAQALGIMSASKSFHTKIFMHRNRL